MAVSSAVGEENLKALLTDASETLFHSLLLVGLFAFKATDKKFYPAVGGVEQKRL